MATSTTSKHEFLVVIPDKPGQLEKRLEVRAKHLEGARTALDAGEFKMGGAMLNEIPTSDDAKTFDFAGSTFICVGQSKESVLQQLGKDIYATSGVWDLEKAQIWPFRTAFRVP